LAGCALSVGQRARGDRGLFDLPIINNINWALVNVVHARNNVRARNDAAAATRVLYPGVALAAFIPRGVVSYIVVVVSAAQ